MEHPQLSELRERVSSLIAAYRKLQDENDALKTEIEQVRAEVRRVHVEEDKLRKTNNALQVANAIGGSDEDKRKAKQRIDRMVNDIDKCLALLAMM